MKIADIPFGIIDWNSVDVTKQTGIEGFGYRRTVQVGEICMQKVEYTPGYIADHWCLKGHILFVVEGTLLMQFQDGREFELAAGTSYYLADNTSPHRSVTNTGVKLIIVD